MFRYSALLILICSVLQLRPQSSGLPVKGLVAGYSFDDGTANDDVGKHNAKNYNAIPAEDCFGNKAHAFFIQGNLDSYLNLGTDSALKPCIGSISIWVKVDQAVYKGKGVAHNPILMTRSHTGNDFNEACNANYAGWFNGNVIRTGTDNFISDRKLKENIKSLSNTLDKIKLLNPCSYTFKRDDALKGMNPPTGAQMGLIAQELEAVFPELVQTNPANMSTNQAGEKVEVTPEFKSVQYVALIPVLISGIKEQQQQIETLKQEIASLKSGNTTGINDSNAADAFALDQNIPNPFTNETVINYNLPQQYKNVSLVVYDLSGKQVTAFPINEKGTSSMTITADKLAEGIYIYSIMADGKILDSKRMVVAGK